MLYFIIIAAVYAIGFLYIFLSCLFEDDHKFGNGPNWTKFWFGLIVGILWPVVGLMGFKHDRRRRN